MRPWLALLLTACAQPPRTVSHDFPELTVGSGEEQNFVCQSWTLDNEEPLHVNALKLTGGVGWHHSNWLYAGEHDYAGPDGTWPCAERGFELVNAGLTGGVLYTQSPEVEGETMAFAPGVAVTIPAHAKIIAELHLLNATAHELVTHGRLELDTIPADEAKVRLSPMAFSYYPLQLPPQAKSQFTTDCDLEASQGKPLDFSIYYVAPHYHALGRGMSFEALHADGTSQMIFETTQVIGQSLHYSPTQPFSLAGAQGIRFACTYENDTTSEVGFSSGQAGEMCVLFAFTDSPMRWIGGVPEGTANYAMTAPDPDMHRFGSDCIAVATPLK